MTKFAKPKPRFDREQAVNGVWFYIEDENGQEYGGFKCGLVDGSVPRARLVMEREAAKSAIKSRGKRDGDDVKVKAGIANFVDSCLIDWDMLDADGKELKFSRERAIEYFLQQEEDEVTGEMIYTYDYAFSRLFALSRDVTQYQSEEQAKAGEPLGN